MHAFHDNERLGGKDFECWESGVREGFGKDLLSFDRLVVSVLLSLSGHLINNNI